MKASVIIDGGHLRVLARGAGRQHVPDYIEKVGKACLDPSETPLRILYYDCAPYSGEVTLPVSGQTQRFSGSDHWLKDLAGRELFAVRLGVLKFRGFTPKRIPISPTPLQDSDFKPRFEQKGVDMRIGLDIASFAEQRTVDRIILITNDTDCIPAMKHARIRGLQVVLARFDNNSPAPELLRHADFIRDVAWPA
jgi:uncharacterized LabA/DUF88 family protein